MENDIFYHRLESRNATYAEYNIACEELIRKHFGKVHQKSFELKPKDTEANLGKEVVELLIEKIKKLGSVQVLYSNADLIFFLAGKWVGQLSIEYQLVGSEDRGITREDGQPGQQVASHMLESINVALVYLDSKICQQIGKAAKKIGFIVLEGFESKPGIPVTFAFPGPRGPEYYNQSFEGLRLQDVAQNYTPSVVEQVEAFLKYARQVTHGIAVMSGPVGTGKSYLIRSILTELSQRRALVCTPPTTFLVQAGLLTQVVANFKKSIIVLEDVGEVIAIDAASKYTDARANLLNFTEGFLSLLTDAILIISFNYELEKIDPAILRPGRCLANITLDELPHKRVQGLVPFEIPSRKYTLAEVYEMRRVGNAGGLGKSQIGFERNL